MMADDGPSASDRAEARRRSWKGGVAKSFDEMERVDLDFWLSMSPRERLEMMWSLVEDSLALEGHDGPAPRLQRSVGGVRPRRS